MALSANAGLQTRNTGGMTELEPVILTGAKIYQHGLQVTTAAGLCVPAANVTTTKFSGLSTAEVASGDGTLKSKNLSNIDVLITVPASVTAGLVGSAAYAVDDASAHLLATLGPEIGTLVEVESSGLAWIRLGMKALASAS